MMFSFVPKGFKDSKNQDSGKIKNRQRGSVELNRLQEKECSELSIDNEEDDYGFSSLR